ncbi:GGDEF domain-containing protein [Rhodococcus sp. 15-2388-1-1a]|uniref:GGDEF domain-containing protein n=1 Tax=Rhodococcus sp. 15-2388-1-1a TaxID=2023142 RepID=UPI0011405F0F|nr:GGDEF domain-containing protein [Rhodococcus sp. 15-2388-1-1a]
MWRCLLTGSIFVRSNSRRFTLGNVEARGSEGVPRIATAQQIVAAIPLPALVHDTSFHILAVNTACRTSANLSRTYSDTRDVFAFVHPTEHAAIRAVSEDLLSNFARTGESSQTPVSAMRRLHQDDDVSVSCWTHTGLAVIDGVPLIVVALDLANPIVSEARTWRELAERDDLTGLYRRNVAVSVIDDWLAAGDEVMVMFADVDHFKQVNDGYGHAAGDAVLSAIADRLHALSHDDRIVCRYAGDEFLIASRPSVWTDRGFVWQFDEQRYLHDYIAAAAEAATHPLGIDGHERVSISTGEARRRPTDSAATLIHRADTAMYRNKAQRVRER